MNPNPENDPFIHELQRALQHLYDLAELRRSPLRQLLGLDSAANPAVALQKALTEAIAALKPGRGVPLHSSAWRDYHILTYAYIEQSSQEAIANSLALSVRQLRRLQRAAEGSLADYLRVRYAIETQTSEARTSAPLTAVIQASGAPEQTPGCEQELEWVRATFPSASAPLGEVVEAVMRTVQPLVEAAQVKIEVDIPLELPPVSGQLEALRQALLHLLTASIYTAPGGSLSLRAELESGASGPKAAHSPASSAGLRLQLQALSAPALSPPGSKPPVSAPDPAEAVRERLKMAQQFICLFGGRFENTGAGEPGLTQGAPVPMSVTLVLPAVEQAPVLFVDDNPDTLRLMQRCLAGSRYGFLAVQDPAHALALAAELQPACILLDILLPGIDGWELLGRLRSHPQTGEIPLVVCTISPEEPLAWALGAAAFLRKPVSQEALLQTLDRLVNR